MNVLFVCRHNRFRSRFAESYLKKINKDKSLSVKSAGIFPGTYPLEKLEVETAKSLGVDINGKPKPVTTELLKWNDLIILITNDVPRAKKLFNYSGFKNKVIVWKIKDSNLRGNVKPKERTQEEKENIEKILLKIKKRVDKLYKEIEKK
jgi:protein-tyrosine-phosphatase